MSGCVGCPYVRIMEATRPVGYAVVCDHPDFARMQGRRLSAGRRYERSALDGNPSMRGDKSTPALQKTERGKE